MLPQQFALADHHQELLTQKYLSGQLDKLFNYCMGLRAEVDAELALSLLPVGGKPYPYGRCERITRMLVAKISIRLKFPSDPIENVLQAFLTSGGVIRTVWGVLREQYFQNAIQVGSLYVDVSNDTVVATKPKVEILPLIESGMESVRDLAHFSEIASTYWRATIWANVLIPSLAPLLPMISAGPQLDLGLQSANDYMIALMCRDRFRQAEAWLRDGPAPPSEVVANIFSTLPEYLHPKTADSKAEAIKACQSARSIGYTENGQWRTDRVRDFVRFMEARNNCA